MQSNEYEQSFPDYDGSQEVVEAVGNSGKVRKPSGPQDPVKRVAQVQRWRERNRSHYNAYMRARYAKTRALTVMAKAEGLPAFLE